MIYLKKMFESINQELKANDLMIKMFKNNEITGILYALRNNVLDPNLKIDNTDLILYIKKFYDYNNIKRTDIHEIIEYLVENGADINVQDVVDGSTLLMSLYEIDEIETMYYLIEKGADMSIKGHDEDLFDLINYYDDEETLNEIKTRFPEQYERYLKNKKARDFNL